MHSEIYAKLDDMPPRFYSDTQGRIQRALRRWSRRLTKVRVFLRDENGPRGGVGTRCRLVLDTERSGSIVTTGRGSDADAALAEALQRARSRVRRWSQRRTARARSRTDRRDSRAAAFGGVMQYLHQSDGSAGKHLGYSLGCFQGPPHFARQIDAAFRLAPAEAFRGQAADLLCCGDPLELPWAQEAPAAAGPGANRGAPRNPLRSPPVRGPTSHRGCGAIHPGASHVREQVLVAGADLTDGRSETAQEVSPLVSCVCCEHLHPAKHPLSVCPACAARPSTMRSLEMSGAYPLSDEAIDDVLTRKSPGNYALGYMNDDTFSVFFVGRSDPDVRQRLHEWVGMPSRYEEYASPAKASWGVHRRGRFPLGRPDARSRGERRN